MRHTLKLLSILSLSLSTSVFAGDLTLSSKDIAQGEFMSKAQEFNGFGCSGSDLSPHLKWSNAPEGTKSFAITAYDPDAPTGSGWWHWQIVNIPVTVMEIPTGAGNTKNNNAPTGSTQIQNDYGIKVSAVLAHLKVMVFITTVLLFTHYLLKNLSYHLMLRVH